MSKRTNIGLNNLRHYSGELGVEAVEKLRTNTPLLADLITEFAFGDIYSIPALSEREKICITISSLVSHGETEALQLHLHSAKHIGLSNEEIQSIILHCIPYTGFPKVIKAIQLFEKIILNNKEVEE
ncbi:carboxymuconolactone decarboxylase family protein [Bacillus sp. Marseille-P3661]|uniref:carboxymuconolactone decarboxylase family protein n=1 Tax=Bacillus sp. Marseille-P3661 TaxID=1936234 RepID=UPI000C822A98|nr:carboxymuconolactone decarboxylase family protein [Bacillus sp. Marseille-P3661]